VSLLSDRDIARVLTNGQVRLTPLDLELIQPASIDVRLDDELLIFHPIDAYADIDPKYPQAMQQMQLHADGYFLLLPGQFALGSTREELSLDGTLAARLEGKSSLGRLGLLTHATAGFIDPGFTGHVTLELVNVSGRPLRLYPGMRIGQLAFFDLTSRCTLSYGEERGSHYQHQRGPTPSRSYLQFTR
jgi:dCTP deaminase